eukprot:1395753-Pyramimonas_sp.AAC.1
MRGDREARSRDEIGGFELPDFTYDVPKFADRPKVEQIEARALGGDLMIEDRWFRAPRGTTRIRVVPLGARNQQVRGQHRELLNQREWEEVTTHSR